MIDGPYSALTDASCQEIKRRRNWLSGLSSGEVAEELSSAGVSRSARLLDVGSGVGVRSIMSAEYLSEGSVRGLERDPLLLSYSERIAAKRGVNNISFVEGDARALPFETHSFEAIRIDSVLWAVPSPDRVVSECKRVLKQEGVLIIRNFDMQGFLYFSYPPLPESIIKLIKAYRAAIRSWGGDPDIGHQIAPLLIDYGFQIRAAKASTDLRIGVAPQSEIISFWQFFEQWREVVIKENWLDTKSYENARTDYEMWAKDKRRQQARTVFFVVGISPVLAEPINE